MTAYETDMEAADIPQTGFLINIIWTLLAETERLKAENAGLAKEKSDLETMLEMTSVHADEIGADLLDRVDASVREIEERVRMISETIPVPVLIVRIADGKFLYANEHTCRVFGLTADELLKHNAYEIYKNPSDRKGFINILNEQGYVDNFQVLLKKSDSTSFWAALFSQPLNFKNEPCVLTVIYDLTERRQAEEEIRRLTEELEQRKERLEKYLMFMLAGQEYGILLIKIKEIIGMTVITPVPGTPDFIKGLVNLRGKVIPVADLRLRLGLEAADYSERTCIIVSDTGTEKQMIGMIADSVTEVVGIRGKDIEPVPEFNRNSDTGFISGMAKIGANVKILLDICHLWEGLEVRGLR